MYVVKIKGEDRTRELPDESGQKLLAKWIHYKQTPKGMAQDTPIQIGGWTGVLSDIRNIELFREAKNNLAADTIGEFKEMHKRKRKFTPEEKAKDFSIIKMVHWAITKKKFEEEPQEIQDRVYQMQLEFFKNEPKRIYPNPLIFKKLYRQSNMLDHWGITGFGYVERVVARDINEAQYAVE